jgi:translation initiation factor 5
MPKM